MKTTNLRHRQDDRGFSLVELIVSILIMSVITAIAVMLLSTSRATYNEVNTDAVLQGDAETVRKFISELALEAKSWGQKEVTVSGNSYKLFWIKALDNDTEGLERGSYSSVDAEGHPIPRLYYYYVFLLRSPNGPLAYGKYQYDSLLNGSGELFGDGFTFPAGGDLYGNDILTDKYSIIAEYVTDISCNTSTSTNNRELISVGLNLFYNDHQYQTRMNFAGRNKSSVTE